MAALDLDPIRDTAHEDPALGTGLVWVGGLPRSERSILSFSRYVGGQIQSPAMVAVAAVVVPHDGRALNDVFPTDQMGLGAPWAGHLKGHNRASIRSLDLLRSSMPKDSVQNAVRSSTRGRRGYTAQRGCGGRDQNLTATKAEGEKCTSKEFSQRLRRSVFGRTTMEGRGLSLSPASQRHSHRERRYHDRERVPTLTPVLLTPS
jgi:hypothetical protein